MTPRVCSFESRRAKEIASLLENQGAVATVAPSMREVALEENGPALDFADRLLRGEVDIVLFFTGVGARALLDVVETRHEKATFLAALANTTVIVRGPKPVAVLKEWGARIDIRAPEPNTWEEILGAIDAASLNVAGRVVAVQEYGEPNGEFYDELERRGANVLPVPVYRWDFPEDTGPLVNAIRDVAAERFDAMMFTSAQQVRNVLRAAEEEGIEAELRNAASRMVIASVGPTCSDALRDCGLHVSVEAAPPKMGPLVRVTVEACRAMHDAS